MTQLACMDYSVLAHLVRDTNPAWLDMLISAPVDHVSWKTHKRGAVEDQFSSSSAKRPRYHAMPRSACHHGSDKVSTGIFDTRYIND